MAANCWNNCTPLQPHTLAMRDRANELWAQAACMADANEVAGQHVHDPADIIFLQDTAAELERRSLQAIRIARPCPYGLAVHCPIPDCGGACRYFARQTFRAAIDEHDCLGRTGVMCPECRKADVKRYVDNWSQVLEMRTI